MKLNRLPDPQRSTSTRRKLSLAVILPLSVGLLAGGPVPAALAATHPVVLHTTQDAPNVPQVDLLEVSFEDGATDPQELGPSAMASEDASPLGLVVLR